MRALTWIPASVCVDFLFVILTGVFRGVGVCRHVCARSAIFRRAVFFFFFYLRTGEAIFWEAGHVPFIVMMLFFLSSGGREGFVVYIGYLAGVSSFRGGIVV